MALSKMVQSEGKMPMGAQEELAPSVDPNEDIAMGDGGGGGQKLSEEEELDANIAYGLLASAFLEDPSIQGIREIFKAQDPAPAAAALISGAIKQITEEGDVELSPNVWLADGGAVDRAVDLIADIVGGLDEATKNAVFGNVVDQIKLMGQSGQQPQGAPPMRAQMAPPMPMGPRGAQPPMAGGMV